MALLLLCYISQLKTLSPNLLFSCVQEGLVAVHEHAWELWTSRSPAGSKIDFEGDMASARLVCGFMVRGTSTSGFRQDEATWTEYLSGQRNVCTGLAQHCQSTQKVVLREIVLCNVWVLQNEPSRNAALLQALLGTSLQAWVGTNIMNCNSLS